MLGEQRFESETIEIERDAFLTRLVRELSGVLQDVVGLDETRGFISVVGAHMGDAFNAIYRRAVGKRQLDREEVADAMVDLKRRIDGDFHVIAQNDDEILLGNRRCPFGEAVEGRPSLCMMTSNVFGRIAAENLGYARVDVEEAFATGQPRCLVRVSLQMQKVGDGPPSGREYFQTQSGDHP